MITTIKQALSNTTALLRKSYNVAEAPVIAQWIISWITGLSHAESVARSQSTLTPDQTQLLGHLLHEHIEEHKPLQYLFGSVPFLGHTIFVRPPILIPRPETEYWCGWLCEQLKTMADSHLTILDLCTGSGCIAIALAATLSKANVYAIDLSEQACALTHENALANNVSIHIIQGDLFSNLPTNLSFDLIVSNPPYISHTELPELPESVKKWEDPGALFAHDEGLDILKQTISQAPSWLKNNTEMKQKNFPNLVVEIGYKQGTLVHDLFKAAGFADIKVHQDLAGKDRFVTGMLWKEAPSKR